MVHYTGATIYFPEQFQDGISLRHAPDPGQLGKDYDLNYFDTELRKKEGTIDGDELLFNMDGYTIVASLSGCYIPFVLLEEDGVETAVKKTLIEPLKEGIIDDIEPAKKQIEKLRENYVSLGKHQTNLHFDKYSPHNSSKEIEFRLLEYFYRGNYPKEKSPFAQAAKLYALFASLPKDKGTPIAMIKDDFKDLTENWDLWSAGERVVLEEEHKAPYIKGKSLEEALKNALIIYDREEMLKKLDFDKVLIPQKFFK